MLASTLFRRSNPWLRSIRLCARVYSQSSPETDLVADVKLKFPSLQQKKPRREPFMKNAFLGNFDIEFLAYPEPQEDDRHKEFFQWLQPIEEYMKTIDHKEIDSTGRIPDHVLEKFKELGVFQGRIPEDYNGLALTNTEFLKLIETVSVVPALGTFLLNHQTSPVDLLLKNASVEQKLHYLPKMASGDFFASVCITEPKSGSRVNIETKAFKSRCNKFWFLDGTKILVSNATCADLFLVFALTGESEFDTRKNKVSLYLIDRNTPGVTVSPPTPMFGLRGFDSCTVTFKNVKIPIENVVGEVGQGRTYLSETLAAGKINIGGQMIGTLKRFLSHLTMSMINREHFGKMMFEYDSTKEVVSKIACSIYAMESILYLTTSMMDTLENQDTAVEEAMVEAFCVSESMKWINEGMQLLGTYSSLKSLPFEQIIRDAYTLTTYQSSVVDTKVLIGLIGLQFSGKHLAEKINKIRNPLMHPKFNFLLRFTEKDSLNLDLQYELHPCLRECADFLEKSLFSLKQSVEYMLMREGSNIINRHMEIRRLSEIATTIYVFCSIISRSSRSYCIGLRNGEHEIKVARMYAYSFYNKIKVLAEDIDKSEVSNGDVVHQTLADVNFGSKKYIFEHPLTRNW